MAWSNKLTQLNDVLPSLAWRTESIERLISIAGIRPQMVSFQGNAVDIWNSVLREADKTGKVDSLVNAVLDDYPSNPYLVAAASDGDVNYSLAPAIDDVSHWNGIDADTLEVLTQDASSILPISFLEKGVKKSRAVAKIEIRNGSKTDVGTGFLFKLEQSAGLYFITNYHVVNEVAQFSKTRVIFDFELDVNDDSKKSRSFSPDKKGPLILEGTEKASTF